MFIKLNNGVVINTNNITTIEPHTKSTINSNGKEIKYLCYTADKLCWYLTEEDYMKLASLLNF